MQPFTRVLGVPWFYEKSSSKAMSPLVKPFTPEEDEQIRRLYPTMHTGELAEMMNRPATSVSSRASFIGVKKQTIVKKRKDGTVILVPVKPGLPKITAEIKPDKKTYQRKPWKKKEIAILIEHYPHKLNSEISKMVRHPVNAVTQKGRELGLKKTKETLARARSVGHVWRKK